MILSHKIWQSLNHPPRQHPIFQYSLAQSREMPHRAGRFLFFWVVILCAFAFMWVTAIDWLPLLLLLIVLVMNTVYGLFWSVNIRASIAQEQIKNTFELYGVLPASKLFASWAFCTGYLHRATSFLWTKFLVRLIVTIALNTLTVGFLVSLLVISDRSYMPSAYIANVRVAYLNVFSIAFFIAFYIDHVQSTILSSLLGMLSVVEDESARDSMIRALVVFSSGNCSPILMPDCSFSLYCPSSFKVYPCLMIFRMSF